jgi:hypothetical protein
VIIRSPRLVSIAQFAVVVRESYEAPRPIILPLQKVTAFLERCNASRGARTVVPTTANRDYHARANLAKSLPTKPDACPNQVAQVAIATLRYLAEVVPSPVEICLSSQVLVTRTMWGDKTSGGVARMRLGLAAESCLWVSRINTSALGAMMPLPQRDSSMSDVPGHSGPDAEGTRVVFRMVSLQ